MSNLSNNTNKQMNKTKQMETNCTPISSAPPFRSPPPTQCGFEWVTDYMTFLSTSEIIHLIYLKFLSTFPFSNKDLLGQTCNKSISQVNLIEQTFHVYFDLCI